MKSLQDIALLRTKYSVTDQALDVFFAVRQQLPDLGSQKKALKVCALVKEDDEII
jgi:hypothetical protein